MIYIFLLIVSIILGIFLKNKNIRKTKFNLKYLYLCIIAAILNALLNFLTDKNITFVISNFALLKAIVFVVFLIGFIINYKTIGSIFCSLGIILNGLVITINNGKMPVDYNLASKLNASKLIDVVKAGKDFKHAFITDNTKLPFLSDVICIPASINGFGEIFSIGDLLIIFGLFLIVIEIISDKSIISSICKIFHKKNLNKI